MSKPIMTVDPDEKYARQRHEREGDVEYTLRCWNCLKDFSVWIGFGNMNQSIFTCPNCDKKVAIEDE